MFGRTLKYLVHWTGYGKGRDTWESAKNFIQEILGHRKNHSQLICLHALAKKAVTTHTEVSTEVDP